MRGFWMDRTEVTNEDFDRFVKATGYVTTAEKSTMGLSTALLSAGDSIGTPAGNRLSPINGQLAKA